MKSGFTSTNEELAILFGRYDWVENYLPSERRYLNNAAAAGGIVAAMVPIIMMVIAILMARKWGLDFVMLFFIMFLLVMASILVGASFGYRAYKRSMPKRVGIGEEGVLFVTHKEEKIFVMWKDIYSVDRSRLSNAGEHMVNHGGQDAGLGFKIVSSDVARRIKDQLKDMGYGITTEGTVTEPRA